MKKCPFCGFETKFKPGDIAIQTISDTRSRFPLSDTTSIYVSIINPKCIYSYKDNIPIVKGHDYICRHLNKEKSLTFPATEDRLRKIEDPNNILKELIKDNIMTGKENFQDLKHHLNKNALKNKLKEKKRLEKEKKKNDKKEEVK